LPDLSHWQNAPLSKSASCSPAEYAETYGSHLDDLSKVSDFFTAQGMAVLDSHAGQRTVTVQGTVAQMNAVFGVKLNQYQDHLPVKTTGNSTWNR
jgi:subtilase family serine protease